MLTLNDLAEKLKQIDEISLMEILEITSEDLVLKFIDRIEDKYDYLVDDFDNDAGEVTGEEEWYELGGSYD